MALIRSSIHFRDHFRGRLKTIFSRAGRQSSGSVPFAVGPFGGSVCAKDVGNAAFCFVQ